MTLWPPRRWPVRRQRQRDRALGAHPDDRDCVRGHDGDPGQRLRRDGTGKHFTAGGLARQRRVQDVTGRMFEVEGGIVRVAEGWAHGPQVDKGAQWDPAELGSVVADLLGKARPAVPVYGA